MILFFADDASSLLIPLFAMPRQLPIFSFHYAAITAER
jgi:hypothetical protein